MEENHGKMRTAARHLLSLIGSTLQGRRLLLVEDNDLNAEIAATILEGDGAYVSSPAMARRRWRRSPQTPPEPSTPSSWTW